MDLENNLDNIYKSIHSTIQTTVVCLMCKVKEVSNHMV